jgi:conjugal transfer pilin signal peptidase TrbI
MIRAAADRLRFLTHASTKAKAWSVVALIGFYVAGQVIGSNYKIYIDNEEIRCMEERLYIGYPQPKGQSLGKGQIVRFNPGQIYMFGLFQNHTVAKKIAGLPGDLIQTRGNDVFINNKLAGSYNPIVMEKLKAKGLTPLSFNKILEPGEVFVMGDLPRSFDSRYWGPIKQEHISGFAKAVI